MAKLLGVKRIYWSIHHDFEYSSIFRMIEMKILINLSNNESLYTINKLVNDNIHNLVNNEFINYYFSPGNIYKMIDFCNDNNIDFKDIKLRDFINILINNNHFKKDSNLKYLFYEIFSPVSPPHKKRTAPN